MTERRRRQIVEAEATPAGCWRSPRGKLLSSRDRISILLSGEDSAALHRAIDATTSHLDEARGGEERVPFAGRLIRIQARGHGERLIVDREDLHALHQALHVAAGHVDDDSIRGSDDRTAFLKRLARIRKTVLDAVCDHDDVPRQERC